MSTFSLDEDQRQIKESMESFAADELRPISRDCDEEFRVPPEFLEKTWGLGLTANIIPEEYGGYGFNRSCLNNVIMAEALAYGDLSLSRGNGAESFRVAHSGNGNRCSEEEISSNFLR